MWNDNLYNCLDHNQYLSMIVGTHNRLWKACIISYFIYKYITETPREHQDVSNQQQTDCLFDRMFRQKEKTNPRMTGRLNSQERKSSAWNFYCNLFLTFAIPVMSFPLVTVCRLGAPMHLRLVGKVEWMQTEISLKLKFRLSISSFLIKVKFCAQHCSHTEGFVAKVDVIANDISLDSGRVSILLLSPYGGPFY